MGASSPWILACLLLCLGSVFSQTECPALTQQEINTNCTTRWYMGIENGSCSELENNRMVYNKYLGCFSDLLDLQAVNLCCSDLPSLYQQSPINERGIRFRFLPLAIRTAICGQFLYYRKNLNETYQNSILFTLAASQNWRDLSFALKTASYQQLQQFYKEGSTHGDEVIPRQLVIINSNAELIDSAYMDSCDYCNICDNQCDSTPKPVSPLGPNPSQAQIDAHNQKVKEHDLMVQTYLKREQEACPADWINGVPGGRQTRIKEIETAVYNLDLTGTDSAAADSRSNFVNSVLDAHFLSCQFKDCTCPYMEFDRFCSLNKEDVFTGLQYSLTKRVMPWKYLNSSLSQQQVFDSFYDRRGSSALKYLKNEQNVNSSLLRLWPSDYLEFKNFELAYDLAEIMSINVDNPAQWTGQSSQSFFTLAMRTALLSIQKKLEVSGSDSQLTTSLQSLIEEKDYVGLMREMKNNGYQSESEIISYSLLPFPCTFVNAQFLIYVDEAMDDGANGDLIKQYLHKQIQGLKFGDDAIRFQMATFYNTNSSDTSQQLNIISPFNTNNTQSDIDSAISNIKLDPANRNKSSITHVLLNAWDIFRTRRAGVNVVVVILSDGNIQTQSHNTVDKLFNDPYWTMNWVALNFQTIAIGVGQEVYQNWDNLFLMGRDLVLQKKSIRKLQSESDIASAVDYVNLAIERTCYNPEWEQKISGQKKNLTLHQGDYKFLAYQVSTLDYGMYLIMELPKDKVEVYASLRSTHPTEYDNDFTAHLRNGRDNSKDPGTIVEYILNVPIFTYEISELLARSESEAYRRWLRPLYIGFHAINETGSKEPISITYQSYLGGEYDVSYWTYFSLAIVFGLIVMACCICGLVFTCKYNQGRGCLCCKKEASFEEMVDREWQLLKEEQTELRNEDALPFIKEESSAKEQDTSKSQHDTSNPLLQVGGGQEQMLLGDKAEKQQNITVGRESDVL